MVFVDLVSMFTKIAVLKKKYSPEPLPLHYTLVIKYECEGVKKNVCYLPGRLFYMGRGISCIIPCFALGAQIPLPFFRSLRWL